MPPPREMTSSSLYWSICTINTKKKFKNNYDLSSTAFIIALQTILTLRHNNLSSDELSVSSLLDSGATAAVILWSVFFFLLGAGVGFLLVTVWSKLSLRLSVPIGSRRFLCKVILRFSPFSYRTIYTGMSGFGRSKTTYGSSSHRFANLCFPSKATILTITRSPTSMLYPLTFRS